MSFLAGQTPPVPPGGGGQDDSTNQARLGPAEAPVDSESSDGLDFNLVDLGTFDVRNGIGDPTTDRPVDHEPAAMYAVLRDPEADRTYLYRRFEDFENIIREMTRQFEMFDSPHINIILTRLDWILDQADTLYREILFRNNITSNDIISLNEMRATLITQLLTLRSVVSEPARYFILQEVTGESSARIRYDHYLLMLEGVQRGLIFFEELYSVLLTKEQSPTNLVQSLDDTINARSENERVLDFMLTHYSEEEPQCIQGLLEPLSNPLNALEVFERKIDQAFAELNQSRMNHNELIAGLSLLSVNRSEKVELEQSYNDLVENYSRLAELQDQYVQLIQIVLSQQLDEDVRAELQTDLERVRDLVVLDQVLIRQLNNRNLRQRINLIRERISISASRMIETKNRLEHGDIDLDDPLIQQDHVAIRLQFFRELFRNSLLQKFSEDFYLFEVLLSEQEKLLDSLSPSEDLEYQEREILESMESIRLQQMRCLVIISELTLEFNIDYQIPERILAPYGFDMARPNLHPLLYSGALSTILAIPTLDVNTTDLEDHLTELHRLDNLVAQRLERYETSQNNENAFYFEYAHEQSVLRALNFYHRFLQSEIQATRMLTAINIRKNQPNITQLELDMILPNQYSGPFFRARNNPISANNIPDFYEQLREELTFAFFQIFSRLEGPYWDNVPERILMWEAYEAAIYEHNEIAFNSTQPSIEIGETVGMEPEIETVDLFLIRVRSLELNQIIRLLLINYLTPNRNNARYMNLTNSLRSNNLIQRLIQEVRQRFIVNRNFTFRDIRDVTREIAEREYLRIAREQRIEVITHERVDRFFDRVEQRRNLRSRLRQLVRRSQAI